MYFINNIDMFNQSQALFDKQCSIRKYTSHFNKYIDVFGPFEWKLPKYGIYFIIENEYM